MKPLHHYEMLQVMGYLPLALRVQLQKYPERLVVAGGLLRAVIAGEKPSDIDVFVPGDAELAGEIALELAAKLGSKSTPHASGHAVTVRWENRELPIQIVHRWDFASPEELLARFDFTISKAALWSDGASEPVTTADDLFRLDVTDRRLRYSSPDRDEDPGVSMLRVLKFYARGYRISLSDLGKIAARLLVEDDFFPNALPVEEEFAKRLLRADKSSDVMSHLYYVKE